MRDFRHLVSGNFGCNHQGSPLQKGDSRRSVLGTSVSSRTGAARFDPRFDNFGIIRSRARGLLKYVATICGLLANTMYLLYLFILWLFVRVVRRLKAYTRQQRLMYEIRRDNLMPKIQ
jgi:hypothetical protein